MHSKIINQPACFTLGGFTVGHAATMARSKAIGTIVGVEDRDGRRFVTLEFDEPQPVDVPEGATSKRFELQHTAITATWAKSGTEMSSQSGAPTHDASAIAARIEADIALLRKVCVEPMGIKLSEHVDIEVRPEGDDDRVLVGRSGWGYTVVNYTSEGLILDVLGNEELDPIHTACIYSSDLESPEDDLDDATEALVESH